MIELTCIFGTRGFGSSAFRHLICVSTRYNCNLVTRYAFNLIRGYVEKASAKAKAKAKAEAKAKESEVIHSLLLVSCSQSQ